MPKLRAEREALRVLSRAPNTRSALAHSWKTFTEWCDAAGREALPASPETVELFLTDLGRTRKVSTLQLYLWAISQTHKAKGLPAPITAGARQVIAAVARKKGMQTAPKAALTPAELRLVVRKLDPATERDVRARAVLVLGFATGLRRSELTGLQLRDVEFVPKGLVVSIRRSKRDQLGQGRAIGVFRGVHALTCPVRALKAWLKFRGPDPGPLFGLCPQSVNEIVQAGVSSIGLDPTKYGSHSLRAGMITAANAAGVPDTAIMKRTGHKNVATLARYVRHRDLFAFDPLAKAL